MYTNTGTCICVQTTHPIHMIDPTAQLLMASEIRVKWALKLSIIDQENALKKIAQWKELSSKSQYYFRPY